MSSLVDQPCYTLINVSSDAEPPTELQLRQDLGESHDFLSHYTGFLSVYVCVHFRWGCYSTKKLLLADNFTLAAMEEFLYLCMEQIYVSMVVFCGVNLWL